MKIGVIYLSGEISRSDAMSYSEEISDLRTVQMITECAKDSDIEAVVLRIDSPGGSAIASETIWSALMHLKSKGKVIIVSMGNVCASGGYYIATAADKILAHPGTITGSIGVVMGKIMTEEAWNHYGIYFGQINTHENSSIWSSRDNYTEKQRVKITQLIDQTYDGFVAKVAKARDIKVSDARAVAKGQVWTGQEAFDRKLVDQLGGLEEAVLVAKECVLKKGQGSPEALKWRSEAEVQIVYFPHPLPFYEKILNSLSSFEEGANAIKIVIKSTIQALKTDERRSRLDQEIVY